MHFLKFENGLKFLRSLDDPERVLSNVAAWVLAEGRKPDIDLAHEENPSIAG